MNRTPHLSGKRILAIALAAFLGLGTALPLEAQLFPHDCTSCHNLHGGTGQALTRVEGIEALCLSCHQTGVGGAPIVSVHTNNPGNTDGCSAGTGCASFSMSCADCHSPHADADILNTNSNENLKLVSASINSSNVVFEARGSDADPPHNSALGSFAEGAAPYDGVCEVCHTDTQQHQNAGGAGTHNAGQNCAACHPHDDSFWGTGGSCVTCHTAEGQGTTGPNNRRPAVDEFLRASTHVPAVTDADCEVCHDQSGHQGGTVRLKNADTGAITVLTGDPNTDQTEADKLGTFCLSCHDADGANGDLTPFSDGVNTPPVAVTAATWAGVSHNSPGGSSCYGCHGSGHGSVLPTLLQPHDTAAAPADWATASLADSVMIEEGFCFRCHDGSITGVPDMKNRYPSAINWVTAPVAIFSNPNLNDRHDWEHVAQTRSGAKIECRSCHSPHTLTPTARYTLDVDPSDGFVPGVTHRVYPTSGPGVSSYRQSEFCLECHDNTFPAGVRGHLDAANGVDSLVNLVEAMAVDGMGTDPRVVDADLRPAGDWWDGNATTGNTLWGSGTAGHALTCDACHSAHPATTSGSPGAGGILNYFQLRDTLYEALGTSGAPDFTKPLPYVPIERSKGQDVPGAPNWNYGWWSLDPPDEAQGGMWCNACHNRFGMMGKTNCTGCHRHADVSRF